jgi:hypothetical protein
VLLDRLSSPAVPSLGWTKALQGTSSLTPMRRHLSNDSPEGGRPLSVGLRAPVWSTEVPSVCRTEARKTHDAQCRVRELARQRSCANSVRAAGDRDIGSGFGPRGKTRDALWTAAARTRIYSQETSCNDRSRDGRNPSDESGSGSGLENISPCHVISSDN